ncbi:DUF924 family protein [Thetidibacter halocola]|uniref:DUF924 domain-containing protein n=1 Tax=Thetidibacter halocola TaxID=2827239 RepID=A0A8J7WED2_9RHOB|nr:DUF924 family protein [Thetidibacter halocola]MBS0125232.1 DUF924 domain-containing protein [Thetidibacter halocola]
MQTEDFAPGQVLDFWFPDSGHEGSVETHAAFWTERMQGGMDGAIIDRFGPLTRAAARGELDHWADTPRGRLALLIALDQFPRSLWRDTPGAFAQDIKAARLALDGIANGDFDGLAPWEQVFFVIALGHCEGPDHLQRLIALDPVIEQIIDRMPEQLAPMGGQLRAQHALVTEVIRRFGRHPHRNAILGRVSTLDEEPYIATGDFPHLPKDNGQPA